MAWDLVPAALLPRDHTTELLALQVADNSNVALFLGPSGNRVADNFDALTYVDVAGATNLDTSSAGLLKPTKATANTVAAQTMSSDSSGWSGINFRQMIAAALISTSGARVRFRLRGPTSGTSVFTGMTIGHKAASGDAWDMAATPVPVTVGGIAAFTLGTSADTWSDWITFALDETKDLVMAAHFSSTSSIRRNNSTADSGFSATNKTAASEINSADVTGYAAPTAGYIGIISEVEVETAAANNMTVPSTGLPATSAPPTSMMALLLIKEVDAAAAGTDYTLECSRDGTTWAAMTLTELFTSPSPTASIRVVEAAETDVSGQPSGTSPRWRFKTLGNKNVELHGLLFGWDP